MAIAIISDIHANKEALDEVLQDILRLTPAYGITEVHCLGDIVGYGPDPEYCARQVRRCCSVALRGNHDEAVCNKNENLMGMSNNDAANSMIWTRLKLENSRHPELADYIANLPIRHFPQEDDMQRRIAEVHGTLYTQVFDANREFLAGEVVNGTDRELMDYACMTFYSTMKLGEPEYSANIGRSFNSLVRAGRSICFLGHSHFTEAYSYDPPAPSKKEKKGFNYIPIEFDPVDPEKPDKRAKQLEKPASLSLEIEPGLVYVINVGSVGQPRGEDPRACYGIYTGDEIIFRRVPYDFPTTMHKLLTSFKLDQRTAGRLGARLAK